MESDSLLQITDCSLDAVRAVLKPLGCHMKKAALLAGDKLLVFIICTYNE